MDVWWIDKPLLLGSRNPTNADLERLRCDGFQALVSLLSEKEQLPCYDVTHAEALGYARHNIPVPDFCAPTVEQLEQFVKLVDELLPRMKMIIHCEGGSGRTGTFATAYWVTKGMTVADAIAHVRMVRRNAVETPEQEEILMKFANKARTPSGYAQPEAKEYLSVNDVHERLPLLIDYVTLVYHEARNVRHLVRKEAVTGVQWKYLMALPVNRNEAWKALQSIRSKAKKAGTVQTSLLPFERHFKVTLESLLVLYGHPAWRNAAYGGNAWKMITDLVYRLAIALEKNQSEEVDELLVKLSHAKHNTGLLATKLRQLDEAL